MRTSAPLSLGVVLLSLSVAAVVSAQVPAPPASPGAPPAAATAPAPAAPPARPAADSAPKDPPGDPPIVLTPGTDPGSAQPPPGSSPAPGSTGEPGRAISPVSPGDGAPLPPADTGHETKYVVPASVTGASDGAASARVGFGFLTGFGKATDPTGWDVSAVIEAEMATSRGLATLIGFERDGEVTQAPIGSLRISASFARLDFEGEGGSAYPPLLLYLGGSIGRASFAYLGPGPERRDQSLPPTLQEREQVALPWSAGAAVIYVPTGWQSLAPTIEGQIAFNSVWTGSADTLSWCEPAGDVVRDVAVETTGFDAASRCKKAVLGAPVNSQDLSLAAQAGLIDKVANATFRAALGIKLTLPLNEEATDDLRLSLRAPFYVTLARAPQGTEYRGMIRLMPSLNFVRRETGTTDVAGLLELSFLGQRGMFSDNYNEL